MSDPITYQEICAKVPHLDSTFKRQNYQEFQKAIELLYITAQNDGVHSILQIEAAKTRASIAAFEALQVEAMEDEHRAEIRKGGV